MGDKMLVQVGSKMAKKGYFHTSHINHNAVFPKKEVVKNHSLLTR